MRNTEHHTFTWASGHLEIEIEIAYTPNLFIYDHLGIHAVRPSNINLPISHTGYRSHYVGAGTAAEFGEPIEAVRIILDEAAALPEWQAYLASKRQGSQF